MYTILMGVLFLTCITVLLFKSYKYFKSYLYIDNACIKIYNRSQKIFPVLSFRISIQSRNVRLFNLLNNKIM